MRRLRDDRGLAAIELGLLMTVMLGLAAFIFPLGKAFYEKHLLDRAVADGIRFATAAPNSPAAGSAARRPSAGEVRDEVLRAYRAAGGSGLSAGDIQVTTADRPGQQVSISITTQVDLGPAGAVLDITHISSAHSLTISVDATGREE